ncbi:hypothetical protein [Streptomyces sp. NPDC086787]|uniref:hypothetical protein n=1 Tax=Streptomyces sp. NPDC086787 TaxID=3365759 RepID=UPI003819FC14
MKQTNGHGPDDPEPSHWTRVRTWTRRRRHALFSSALRGAAYGTGTGIVGLVFWWVQRQLL